jgi:hypothetical protein
MLLRPARRGRFAPVLAASALLLAGCGGGSSTATGSGATTGGGTHSGAYNGGHEICSGGTVEEISSLYGVTPATKEAVAKVIAEAVSGGSSPQDATDATQGCLDAFAEQK